MKNVNFYILILETKYKLGVIEQKIIKGCYTYDSSIVEIMESRYILCMLS